MLKKVWLAPILFCWILFLPRPAAAAKLLIDPPTGSYRLHDKFQVRIILDTQQASTAGTDVLLNFDPAILNAVGIYPGKIYDTYLGKNINNKNGTVSVSGIISLDNSQGYSGKDIFATLVFTGIAPGTSRVAFDYAPGGKNDSNVALLAAADDNLNSATGATYTIFGDAAAITPPVVGTPASAAAPKPSAPPSFLPSPTPLAELPQSGSSGTTLQAIFAGLAALLAAALLYRARLVIAR